MKLLQTFRQKNAMSTWLLIMALIGLAIGLIIACGKLSDESGQPSTPVGSTSGVPIPTGPQSSLGTYTFSLWPDMDILPADGVTYTVLHAQLEDSSGRSVADRLVTFSTSTTSDAIGYFIPPGTTPGSGSPSTMITGRTNQEGVASVRLYGIRSGSCVIEASVDVDGNGSDDLFVTTQVQFTRSTSPGMAGGYTFTLEADPDEIPADAVTDSLVTATVTDTEGGRVEDLEITFTEPTNLGQFEGSQTTYVGTTNLAGKVPVRFFGLQPGTALIQARVFIPEIEGYLQATVNIKITAGPGVPGAEIGGVFLTTDNPSQTLDVGTCGEGCAEATFPLYADVWDEDGYRVGAGVRVEFYTGTTGGTLIGYGETDSNGRATVTLTTPSLGPGCSGGSTWSLIVRAEAYFNDQTYTDTITLVATTTCTPPEPTPIPSLTVSANPSTITAPNGIAALQACTSDLRAGVTINFVSIGVGGITGATSATTETVYGGCTPPIPPNYVIYTAPVTTGGVTQAVTITVTASGYVYTAGTTTITVTIP